MGDGKALKAYNAELAKATDITEDVLRLKTQQIKTEKKLVAATTVDAKQLAEAKIQLQQLVPKTEDLSFLVVERVNY